MAENPATPAVMELIEQGLAVVKMENENMNTLATQRPRDMRALTEAAYSELRMFPAFAHKAYYSIPYKDYSSGELKTVMVEGPSIKAANSLIRNWGNNSSGWRIVGADDERVQIQGVIVDHETGVRRMAEMSVSRKFKKRNGEVYTLAVDRLDKAIQAGGSKAVRNAILNYLPLPLVEGYFALAKQLAARGGKAPAAERYGDEGAEKSQAADTAAIAAEIERSLKRLEVMGVERAEVSDYIQRRPELSTEEEVSAHLVGLLNAIEDGQTSIEEVFTVPDATVIAAPARASERPASPPPAAAAAPLASPAARPAAGELPKDRRRMQAKLSGSVCRKCGKPIHKDEWIWKDLSIGLWVHERCPA